MRFVRARFKNFRLLRDVEIRFSTDANWPLTVVRAANDSGKTTLLHGLQWAVYGDTALPGKGKDFRLHPIDWDVDRDGAQVEVSAVLEFEKEYRRGWALSGADPTWQRYRLQRSAVEAIGTDSSRRVTAGVTLLARHAEGWREEPEATAWLAEELSDDLREVFFTDGDRALGFIQAEVARSTRRKKVENAIRTLLGLGLVDNALRHLGIASRDLNKKARKLGGSGELCDVSSRLVQLSTEQDELKRTIAEASEGLDQLDMRVATLDEEIATALINGNRQDLQEELAGARNDLVSTQKDVQSEAVRHGDLFCGVDAATALLEPALRPVRELLDKMRDSGRIPSATIPVLQERLDAGECICGESLRVGDSIGEARRSSIQKMIDDNRREDEVRDVVTELFYWSKGKSGHGGDAAKWQHQYRAVVARRDDLKQRREIVGRKVRALEKRIESLPDKDVQGLQETRMNYLQRRDVLLEKQAESSATLKHRRDEARNLEQKRDRLLRARNQGQRVLAGLDVVNDVKTVLSATKNRMANDELTKVSDNMNRIFLGMIGVDPEQGAIIRQAKVSESYDIVVFGPQGRKLNPDKDLNGASRRALTLAFILALAKVSGVSAPNVIDTPLGMASGYVKRSMLRLAVQESRQLILFLTHDEILGCEEALDKYAGEVVTFSNPAHYPKMLRYDIGSGTAGVIACDCDHTRACSVCERHPTGSATDDE